MKLLVLSLLVAAATASPLLGSDRCTWGPSYWCQHISAAKECNAVQHCISTVWKNQKLPAFKDDPNCLTCKLAIEGIDVALGKNSTQQEIKAYLDQACSVIPDPNLATECKQTVDKYLQQIIQMIVAKLDPKTICTMLGFCTAASQSKVAPKPQAQKPLDTILGHVQLIKTQTKAVKTGASEGCVICKTVMEIARNEISNNKTQAEIEAFIEKYMCGNLGSMKDECDKMIQEYAPVIFQFLSDEMDPEAICRGLGLCTSTAQKKPLMSLLKESNGVQTMSQVPLMQMSPAKKPVHASPQCVLCEFLMSKLEDELKDNATEQEIIHLVEKVCTLLPSTVEKECTDLIQRYGSAVIVLLVNQIKPDAVCKILGLCSTTQRVPKYNFGGEGCVLCETMAMYLQGLLKENSTEIVIKQELERVCNSLPDTEASICDGIVLQYADKIILALANKISAKDLCQFIGLCPKSKTYKAPKLIKKLEVDLKSTGCTICEFVMKELDDILKENRTEVAVEAALDKVCGLLPTTFKDECDDFVKMYGPMVIRLLVAQLDPKTICTELGLCTSKSVPVKKVGVSPSCEVCELAAGYLHALLGKNATQAEIEAALEKLCGYLPSSVKNECDALVSQYGPVIVKLLIQELAPDMICKELGLCSSKKAAMKEVTPSKPRLLGAEKCTYGPSYWCANFDNAKKCNAVEHCNKHVWKNEV